MLTVGANVRSIRAGAIFSPKVAPRPLGMLKQVFLAHFEPMVTHFGPWKIPKCLENGLFWDQGWVKNGSITRFPAKGRGPFRVHKQDNCAHVEPILTRFRPSNHMNAPSCILLAYLRAVLWSHVELGRGV